MCAPERARGGGQRERQLARIEVAVVGDERRGNDALRRHRREELLRLARAHDLHRQPERLRPRRLTAQLLVPRLRRREPQAAELVPPGIVAGQLLQLGVQPDRVLHHPRERDRAAQLADQAGAVPGRPVRELVLLDEHRVLPPLLREVIEDRAADHTSADHDCTCALNHAHDYPRLGSRGAPRGRPRSGSRAARRGLRRAARGRADEHELQGRLAARDVRGACLGKGHRDARDRPRERGAQHALRSGDGCRRAVRRVGARAGCARARVPGWRGDEPGEAPPRRPVARSRARMPPPARRRPVLGRLRHVRDPAPVPRRRAGTRLPPARPLPRVRATGSRARGGDARAAGTDRAMQQRPPRGELHRLRRRAEVDRLRVLREQRAVVRARERVERVESLARAARASRRRVLRRPAREQGRPLPCLGAHVEVRLDAVGLDPGRDLRDRLRLLGLGDGEVRARRCRVRRPRLRAAARRRPPGRSSRAGRSLRPRHTRQPRVPVSRAPSARRPRALRQ